MSVPGILIAGLRGGGGKTLVSLALAAACHRRGLVVVPFKKGPDYIDSAWLAMAAGRACRNLDLYMMSPQAALRSYRTAGQAADLAVIEGNRGLFDGMDAQGSYSTAELAKLLGVPVVLVVDCTKSTRTVAATVLGCQRLDPEVPLRGVILNQTAGSRHRSVLREAVNEICGLPVLGAVAKLGGELFPERHLGLVPPVEHDRQASSLDMVAGVAEEYLDMDAILNLARQASDVASDISVSPEPTKEPRATARVGVFRDAAFQFYYPENIEALARHGAEVVDISPLGDAELPKVDALYIGGGFPETAAGALARNRTFLSSLRAAIDNGLPVYAECGGTVFLGEKLVLDDNEYPMTAALPISFGFQKKPQGHGYVELKTVVANPFFAVGKSIRGHEFHYTYMEPASADDLTFAFQVHRGHGFDGRRDGLVYRNVLACYTHVHALGTESWAPGIVQAAVQFSAGGSPKLEIRNTQRIQN